MTKMFKKLIKISYHPVGLESGKCVCMLKPCGFRPRENRSLNCILESVKMAVINKRANYYQPAEKNMVYFCIGGTNINQCICLNTRIRAFSYRN